MTPLHVPRRPVRLVTAASLFDRHDASISIMRRILQTHGCEVFISVTTDQRRRSWTQSSRRRPGRRGLVLPGWPRRVLRIGHVRVFGGGGGVIVPDEIKRLRASGVTIFSPKDGQRMGLPGMVNTVVEACDYEPWVVQGVAVEQVLSGHRTAVAWAIKGAEFGRLPAGFVARISDAQDPGRRICAE